MPLILISLLFVTGATAILLFPILPIRSPYNLQAGDVAPEDIRAPRQITYVSLIETQEAREAARAAVADVYDPADPRVGRQQVRRARQIMDFVQDVRADPYADEALRRHYLSQITGLNLSNAAQSSLLTISSTQFEQVEREIVTLVEEAMSGPVREGRTEEAISRLELRVSTDLDENLIPLTVTLASELIVPNSALNEMATEAARAEAEAAVREIRHTFQPGEIVVRAGERLDELDMEALVALRLATAQMDWNDIASALTASLLALAMFVAYMAAFHPRWADRADHVLVLCVLFLIFLAAAQIVVPGQASVGYLFPAAALSLAVTALVGLQFAVVATIVLAGLVGALAGGSFEAASFTAVSGLLAAGSLRRDARLNNYFLAGIAAAVGGMGALLVFQLPAHASSAQLLRLGLITVLNGLLSAGLALVILFVVGNITGITTTIQLIDLMRPDHPLQRRMQREALGSYQHTLSVANLVEAAAEAIGADSVVARIGTLYHDIGKMSNPGFFIENRTELSLNPHDGLDPLDSARIVRSHVAEGIRLARKYRLPPRIAAFIPEHHGTTPIAFFLARAREHAAAAGVTLDEREFHYDGPLPQSKETAILMLADGCESAVRANRPATQEEMEAIVTRIIQQRLDQHQLDESGLTLTDIRIIKETFVRTLMGMYHPRIRYPGDEEPTRLGSSYAGELPSGKEVAINHLGIDQ